MSGDLNADEFRNCVRMYVEYHDQIAAASKHQNEMKKKKDAVGKLIVEFMKSKNIDECELQDSGGKLVRRESKRTEPLKKEHILQELLPLVSQDASRADAVLELMMQKRAVETKDVLTRTKR